MKAVILAGGYGTRLSEETIHKPKPMVEIGGKPILWHIMKIYSHYGINQFIICCGYKGYLIKEYFSNYFLHQSDITFDLEQNEIEVHQKRAEKWKVTLVDTGLETMTGGRLKRVEEYLKNDKYFFFTYGDGVSDINISHLLKFHKNHGKIATMTSVYPPARFGALEIKNNQITKFKEKPRGDGALVNGGFFVLSNDIFNYLDNNNTVWEREPLEKLAEKGELMSYKHKGFWQPMDTIRDRTKLNELLEKDNAPWKLWE